MPAPLVLLSLACTPSAQAPEPAPETEDAGAADAADAGMSPARPGMLTEDGFQAIHALRADDGLGALAGQALQLGDGSSAYLSLPASHVPGDPAVLVIHEWWGLNDHIRRWADRLAEDGYAALAIDLYGGQVATESADAMEKMKAVDPAAAQATIRAGHSFLTDHALVRAGKTGVLGWCFGGGWALQAAIQQPELDATVIYYGRLVTEPDPLKDIQGPILGIFAERDAGIPIEDVRAFESAAQEAGVPVQIKTFDADHAFANPSGERYNTTHAAAAWDAARQFLSAQLKEG